MSEPLITIIVCTPMIIGLIAGAIAWRVVTRPTLFLVVSLFSLMGVQAVLSPIAVSWFFTRGPVNEAFIQSIVAGAIGVALIGIPLLWWLYRGLRRV